MTRLDASLSRSNSRSWMEVQSRRGSVSQHPEPRGERDPDGGRFPFGRSNRFRSQNREDGDSSLPPYRHYERGHPLPSNSSPERKATIPFRNRELGLPSYRRRSESLHNEYTSGLSPQRYMPYSNFRRGDSQSRGSPRSLSPRSPNVSPDRLPESRGSSHRRSSTSQGHSRSYASSHQASGNCSPSRKRGSIVSRTASPSRSHGSSKQSDSPGKSHRRTPSQNSHSLDSEKLYNNLKSIASSADSDDSQDLNAWSKRSNSKMEIDGSYHERDYGGRNSGRSSRKSGRNSSHDISPPRRDYDDGSRFPQKSNGCNSRNSGYNSRSSIHNSAFNSRDPSPPRRGNGDNGRFSPRGNNHSNHVHDSDRTYTKSRTSERSSRTDLRQSEGSWHGSAHSLHSPASPDLSRNTPPPRRSPNQRPRAESPTSQAVTTETDKTCADRSRSNIRRGLEALIFSENARSPSQGPGVPEMTIEDYVVIADIPRPHLYTEEEEEGMVLRRRPQSRSPRRDYHQQRYSDVRDGYSEYVDAEERGRGRERGRDRRERERRRTDKEAAGSSESSKTTSVYTQRCSKPPGDGYYASNRQDRTPRQTAQMQLDILNVKKGWMSRLDENGEWRKYWFVLADAVLRYYQDSEAEERDEPAGEIALQHCIRVTEFEVQKNYGLQIQIREGVVTLSAMTSRIRRSWIDALRRSIMNRPSPDVTQLPDSSGSDKENSVSHDAPSHVSASHLKRNDSTSEITDPHQDDPDLMSSPLTNQREAGEGRDKEHERRLEDRTKWFQGGLSEKESMSRWDTVELKKGIVPLPQIRMSLPANLTGPDIERKWADFERLPLGEMRSLSMVGSQGSQSTNEALQREVMSLRQQIDSLRKMRSEAAKAGGPCGPGAPCVSRMEEVERSHREELENLQREHEREIKELEKARDRLLQQEAQSATQAMDALRKAHREEVEREVEQVWRLSGEGGGVDQSDTPLSGQPSEMTSLQTELSGLSERYSQKCLELNRTQHSGGERDAEVGRKEREMERLRKENQELQARLTEEITLMRAFITGQRSGVITFSDYERNTSELEMLLRVKENEIESLQKEITCLRNEVLSLTKEKQAISERYKEVYVELSTMKGRSQREITTLREHLRLTNAALEEEHLLGNGTDH